MDANAASLRAATEFVRTGAREANLPEARIGELDLLIEEIFMNTCCHAYQDGRQGVVPPNLTLNLGSRAIGGLGIFLVKELASSLSYRRDRGWNRLTFGISARS